MFLMMKAKRIQKNLMLVSSHHGCPLAYTTAPPTGVQRPATLLSLCATLTTLINNNIIALD